jgi:hypothetical protein
VPLRGAFKDMLMGTTFIHVHKIVQGDMKLENALIKSVETRTDGRRYRVMISDYGLAVDVGQAT